VIDASLPARHTGGVHSDERLESGYGPATPAGDNVCNDFVRGEAAGYRRLAQARGDRVAADADLALTMTDGSSPTPFGNAAFTERPLEPDEWEAAAARLHAFYGAAAGGPFLVFSAWPTPDLRGRGFGLVGHPPLMWRPHVPITADAPQGVQIERVDASTIATFEQVLVEGYPVPELQQSTAGRMFPPATLDAGWSLWLGSLDGTPVATAAAFDDGRLGHVEFIASLPSARGRGIGAAMTAVATAAYDRPATLIASDPGRPIYERLGYVALLRYTLWAGFRSST